MVPSMEKFPPVEVPPPAAMTQRSEDSVLSGLPEVSLAGVGAAAASSATQTTQAPVSPELLELIVLTGGLTTADIGTPYNLPEVRNYRAFFGAERDIDHPLEVRKRLYRRKACICGTVELCAASHEYSGCR